MTKVSKKSSVKKTAQPAKAKSVVAKSKAPKSARPVKAAVEPATPVLPPLSPSAPPVVKVSKEERHRMVAEAAYYISLKKGPSSDPRANWVEAEKQIDAQIHRENR